MVRWRTWQIEQWNADLKLPEKANEGYVGPLRKNLFAAAWQFYATHPVEFINHWVDTYDPRNATSDTPTRLPMVMFENQEELILFLKACLDEQENGAVDKSREMGATWGCCAFTVWAWLFLPGSSIGWGSRKQELVDRLGDIDSIFEKMRQIIRGLPRLFLPRGFSYDKHMMFMRILNPENSASITGEVGDEIGRGGRKSMYFKDESAHYEHPEAIEAALMDNTRVQIDISTQNGIGTVYDRRVQSAIEWRPGKAIPKGFVRLLVMDWSKHPTKTREWYETRKARAKREGLLHKFKQEVDRDPAASLVGIIIPADWVSAAVDAHVKLNFGPMGRLGAAYDVADEGQDLNALVIRKGPVLRMAEEWSGDEESVGGSTRKVLGLCGQFGPMNIQYDCIGQGVGVKSEAARLRKEGKFPAGFQLVPWDAGAAVLNGKKRVIPGDKQSPIWEDFAKNLKAQGWWELRRRFEKTYQMVTEPETYNYPFDELISLPSSLPLIASIRRELSQPVVTFDSAMRILVDKKPEGAKSPNLGDAIMMAFFPLQGAVIISEKDRQWAKNAQPVRRDYSVPRRTNYEDDDQTGQFT